MTNTTPRFPSPGMPGDPTDRPYGMIVVADDKDRPSTDPIVFPAPEDETEAWQEEDDRADAPIWLSLVLATRDDAVRLGDTLRDASGVLGAMHRSSEIVVVDDGSTDGTPNAVQKWVAVGGTGSMRGVRMVRHARARGIGAAARAGLAVSRGRWTLMMDPRGGVGASEVGVLLDAAARSCAGLVIGSRALADSTPPRLTSWTGSGRYPGSLLAGARRAMGPAIIRDARSGFRLVRRDVAELIARRGEEDGPGFGVEHLAIAWRSGMGVEEVGVRWTPTEQGRLSMLRERAAMAMDTWRLGKRLATMRQDGLLGGLIEGGADEAPTGPITFTV